MGLGYAGLLKGLRIICIILIKIKYVTNNNNYVSLKSTVSVMPGSGSTAPAPPCQAPPMGPRVQDSESGVPSCPPPLTSILLGAVIPGPAHVPGAPSKSHGPPCRAGRSCFL